MVKQSCGGEGVGAGGVSTGPGPPPTHNLSLPPKEVHVLPSQRALQSRGLPPLAAEQSHCGGCGKDGDKVGRFVGGSVGDTVGDTVGGTVGNTVSDTVGGRVRS